MKEKRESTTKKPKLTKAKLQLKIKKKYRLKVKNYKGNITWSSTDTSIARVKRNGEVTARSAGDAVITAKAGSAVLKCKIKVVEQTKYLGTWDEKNGRCYYYDTHGVKAVGKKKINNHYYYFDEKGRQRVGWIRSKGSYYFFHIASKGKGYMVQNKTVNGIKLGKTGAAKLTSVTREKVGYLVDANNLCFEYVDFKMTKKQALKKMFGLMATSEIISYRNYGPFTKSKHWDLYYANYYFKRGIGDCYTAGCAFAYIATALGYQEVYAVSSGGHGWCKIGDRHYDPNWSSWGAINIYDGFAVKKSSRGKKAGIVWDKQDIYRIKIS